MINFGEELAGPEKLGLAPKVLQNLWGYAELGIVQKVFSEKASAIAKMRQKCVKNASEMRQNGSCFVGKRGTSKMRQKLRQKCVTNASKTPLGENTLILDDAEEPFFDWLFTMVKRSAAELSSPERRKLTN